MSGVSDDGRSPLHLELLRLWQRAGRPSVRAIADCAGSISHTTVHHVLHRAGPGSSKLATIESIALALGGDLERIEELWTAETGSGRPSATLSNMLWEFNRNSRELIEVMRELTDELRRHRNHELG